MLPVAIACSAVATRIAIVAFIVCARIASCAATASVITSGSGPSSRIEPREHERHVRASTQACMMPSRDRCPARTAAAIDPAARTLLIARMCSPWPPCVAFARAASCRASCRRSTPRCRAPRPRCRRAARRTKPFCDEPDHVGARARVHERRPGHPDRIPAALALVDEDAAPSARSRSASRARPRST